MWIALREDGEVIADQVICANTIFARFKGLMLKKKLKRGEGMWLIPANSIHTHFMRFAICAVFLNEGGEVLHIRRRLKPWRIVWPIKGAKSLLELPEGSAEQVRVGDRIVFKKNV